MDKSASQKEDMEQVEDDDEELYNDVVAFVVEQQKAVHLFYKEDLKLAIIEQQE